MLKLAPANLPRKPRLAGTVAILSAGTADGGVAEECRVMADAMGCYCFRISDLSVDGLHRVLQNVDTVRPACGHQRQCGCRWRQVAGCRRSGSLPERLRVMHPPLAPDSPLACCSSLTSWPMAAL